MVKGVTKLSFDIAATVRKKTSRVEPGCVVF